MKGKSYDEFKEDVLLNIEGKMSFEQIYAAGDKTQSRESLRSTLKIMSDCGLLIKIGKNYMKATT